MEVAWPTLRMPGPRQCFSRVRTSGSFPYPRNELSNHNVCTYSKSERKGRAPDNLEAPGMAQYHFNKDLWKPTTANAHLSSSYLLEARGLQKSRVSLFT